MKKEAPISVRVVLSNRNGLLVYIDDKLTVFDPDGLKNHQTYTEYLTCTQLESRA